MILDKAGFEALWQEAFADPLIALGFNANGKTLRHFAGTQEVAVLRLGGRMARPGTVSTVLGFRHTFIRPVHSEDPDMAKSWEDYLETFLFEDFVDGPPSVGASRRNELGMRERDTLVFADCDNAAVKDDLRGQVAILRDQVLPWAATRTPRVVLSDFIARESGRWDEALWIDDYKVHLQI